MRKGTYEFSARYQGIDFERIVRDNPGEDFIEVKWQAADKERGGLLL
jgi:hypothetical protein